MRKYRDPYSIRIHIFVDDDVNENIIIPSVADFGIVQLRCVILSLFDTSFRRLYFPTKGTRERCASRVLSLLEIE